MSSTLVDTTPPTLVILTPVTGVYFRSQSQIAGTCEDPLPVKFEVDGVQNATTLSCLQGAFSLLLPATVSDGDHFLNVIQVDASGNKTVQTVFIKVDNTAPQLQVTSPVVNATLTATNLNLTGSCETGLQIAFSGSALAAPLDVVCSGGSFSQPVVLATLNGAKTIVAEQTDLAGNKTTITRNVTVNINMASLPVIKINSPAAGFLTNVRNLNLQGSCETGLPVVISGTGLSAGTGTTVQTSCTGGSFQMNIQLTTGNGTKYIVASQTNAQSKTGQDARSFQLDMITPTVTILTPAAGTQSLTGVTLGGNCETGLPVEISGTGILAPVSAPCTGSVFQLAIAFSANPGTKVIDVSQIDLAGNVGSSSRSFERIQPLPADGKLLYANNCASCHSPLDSSSKKNRSALQISDAIKGIPSSAAAMKSILALTALTAAEVSAIATALANVATPPGPIDGALLYTQSCQGCHNPLATSSIKDKSAFDMSVAFVSIPAMNGFINLSQAEREAIARELSSNKAPATVDRILTAADAFGATPLKRLTRFEIVSLLKQVFRVTPGAALVDKLPFDTSNSTYFDNDTVTKNISSGDIQSYYDFAQGYAALAASTTDFTKNLAGCQTTAAFDETCFRSFASKLGRLVLRRVITSQELDRYVTSFKPFAVEEARFNAAIELLMFTWLQHPEFLYRIEEERTLASSGLYTLSAYETASRIAFLAWGTGPDDLLLTAAESGQLTTATSRASHAGRLFKTAQGQENWKRYHAQWLGYEDTLGTTGIDGDLRNETAALVNKVVYANKEPWLNLFSSTQTYVTPALAQHYGMPQVAAPQWVTYDSHRGGGVMSHGSFLSVGGKFGDTSPSRRGYEYLKRMLCWQRGSIPIGVDVDTPPSNGGPNACKTVRYNMRNNVSCMHCHMHMDSLGFGLENLGAKGEWRDSEPNNTACTISGDGGWQGNNFKYVSAFADLIQDSTELRECAARRLLEFTWARGANSGDRETVRSLGAVIRDSLTLQATVEALAQSSAMTYKKKGTP